MKKNRAYFNWLIIQKKEYLPLDDNEYYNRFGVTTDAVTGNRKVTNKDLLEKAFARACENRDFEIDKFWTRAAYFWGFIVLIFGGYITILTGEHTNKALSMRLDFYLLLLGFLFSLSWYLVIRGSKTWQCNWEAHIDSLENFVSGPLYKTVFYSGDRFYSVSKLNEVMAIVVIIVWIGLIWQYLIENCSLAFNKEIDWTSITAIFSTLVFATVLIFGYSSGSYKSTKNKFIDRWELNSKD